MYQTGFVHEDDSLLLQYTLSLNSEAFQPVVHTVADDTDDEYDGDLALVSTFIILNKFMQPPDTNRYLHSKSTAFSIKRKITRSLLPNREPSIIRRTIMSTLSSVTNTHVLSEFDVAFHSDSFPNFPKQIKLQHFSKKLARCFTVSIRRTVITST